jgi:hypothetical protein
MAMDADAKVTLVIRDIAEGIDTKLEKVAGERMGFIVAAFPLDRAGHATYISNCYRQDTIKALRHLLMGLETQSISFTPAKK